MQKLIFTLLIVAASVGVFWNVKDSGFVWNDRVEVLGATQAPDRVTPAREHIAEAWRFSQGEVYAPVADTAWGLLRMSGDGEGASPSPKSFHVTSMVVHTLNAVLVFLILGLCLQNYGASFLGALVFALHPLQVEPVAYVSAFRFVIGGFFSLLAIWQYLHFSLARDVTTRAKRNPMRHYYVATICFVLAMLSMPTMVVAPLLAMVLERLLPKRGGLLAPRPAAWPLSLWLLLALPFAIFCVMSQSTEGLASQLPLWAKPVVAADALSFYASKLFAPVFIGPDYGRSPSFLVSHWWGFVTWILPFCLVLGLLYWRGKSRAWFAASFALLVFGLLPFLGLVHFEAQSTSTVANRFAYLAMLGPALALAYTVSIPKRTWLPLLGVAVVIAFGYLSRVNVQYWQSDEALWSHAVSINPGSPIAHETLGNKARAEENWEQARLHYQKVLEVNSTSPDIQFYLGEVERLHGDPKKAAEYFQKTLAIDPEFAPAYSSLGLALLSSNDFDAAQAQFQKAVELKSDDPQPLKNLGMLYVRKKAYADAVPFLTRALQYAEKEAPTLRAETHALLGLALANTSQADKAQQHLEESLKLDPNHMEAHRTLADIYFAEAKYEAAGPHYEKAVESVTNDPEVYNNLGIILSMNKEYDKAISHFSKALELKPKFADAHNNVGISLFRLKRFKEAEEHFTETLALKADQADPLFYLGDIARWQGKQSEALNFYYRTLKINPTHVEAHYRLGNYFMKEANVQQAIRHYKAALRVSPEDPKLIYSLKKAETSLNGGTSPEDQGSETL